MTMFLPEASTLLPFSQIMRLFYVSELLKVRISKRFTRVTPGSFTFALRKLVHAIYSDFCAFKKDKNLIGKILIDVSFNIFAQNIDCGYMLELQELQEQVPTINVLDQKNKKNV